MRKNLLMFIAILFLITGCNKKKEDIVLEKFTNNFFGTFDTVVQTVMYAESEEKAKEYNDFIESRFNELHKEFDKYNSYEGFNNVKTINTNAGNKQVKVSDDLFNMISKSIELYNKYNKKTDISFGAVLNVWSNYRDINETLDPNKDYNTKDLLPSKEELENANKFTGIENIVLDEKEKTVFISNGDTQIDVGAIAKGYAVEIVANELKEMGCESFLISAGGNVKAVGAPKDGLRAKWGIGIQNPNILFPKEGESNIIETIFINDYSVVTSGDYQRFFQVDGKIYNHLIDPETLFPGNYFRAVTVLHPDSGVADFLSTSVFLMPYEEGRKLIESIENAEGLWINNDDSIVTTEGLKKMMLSEGATGGK